MEFLHNNAAENARLQKRKNSLAGTLAKTLGFVSISFIILLLFLALNSFTVQGYARLINESGKISGGIKPLLKIDPESQEIRDIANQIDASIYELQKLEKSCPLLYGTYTSQKRYCRSLWR